MSTYINPRTGRPLNHTAAGILECMGGALEWLGNCERSWPIGIGIITFGSRSAENAAIVTLEKAGLIECTEFRMADVPPADLRYRITDAGRALVAPEVERQKARKAQWKADQQAKQAELDRQQAESDRVARIVAAYPDLLEALREIEQAAQGHVPVLNNWVHKVCATAIAKAEGK